MTLNSLSRKDIKKKTSTFWFFLKKKSSGFVSLVLFLAASQAVHQSGAGLTYIKTVLGVFT